MEILLLIVASFGGGFGLRPLVADFIRNVSWGVIVCTGIAVGTSVTNDRTAFMGLFGFLTAPLAFEISRVIHRGALAALAITGGDEAGGVPVLLIAILKGAEYGILGLSLGWIWNRTRGGLTAHIGAGLAIGIVFGGTITVLTFGAGLGTASATAIISQIVNEVLFPVGCALVLFAARALGDK